MVCTVCCVLCIDETSNMSVVKGAVKWLVSLQTIPYVVLAHVVSRTAAG